MDESEDDKYQSSCYEPDAEGCFNAIFMYYHNVRKSTNKKPKSQIDRPLENINDNQVDNTDRDSDKSAVESVKESAMSWYEIA